jgi:dynein heavy chain
VSADVAPAQADEVTKIKRKANQFDVRNFEFREDFNKRAPTRFDAKNAYDRIDGHFAEWANMDGEMRALEKKADLFVVRLPEYKQLRTCRKELGLLKALWDTIYMVRFQFQSWSQTLWADVNVEDMEVSCKSLSKQIRQLDKDTRAWEGFNGVDAEVKNMVTSLGAVGLLQSSAIRRRHWEQVMKATGVEIAMGESTIADETTLADLLSLHLHEYEEEVASIVDRASKEQVPASRFPLPLNLRPLFRAPPFARSPVAAVAHGRPKPNAAAGSACRVPSLLVCFVQEQPLPFAFTPPRVLAMRHAEA